jgi:hypothetical protein
MQRCVSKDEFFVLDHAHSLPEKEGVPQVSGTQRSKSNAMSASNYADIA